MMTAEDFANAIGEFRREMAGKIRRMVIGRSNGGIWQALGHALFDATKREAPDVENYPGIGIFARPPDRQGEAIVVQVGGPNNPAIIAARDEATRAKVDAIAADETTIYNAEARVYLKHDGTIEARTHAGVAVKLCTLADAQAMRADLNNHSHLYIPPGSGGGAPIATTGNPAVTAPVGTSKFKAE